MKKNKERKEGRKKKRKECEIYIYFLFAYFEKTTSKETLNEIVPVINFFLNS